MICKFCGCSDDRACQLPVDIDGNALMIADPRLTVGFALCCWVIPGVCSAPECIEKAYAEERPLAEQIMGVSA